MIVTLTPNPSVDRTLLLPELRRGAINRAGSVTVEPSGKGVNVARALAASGHAATAVLPLGGPEGEHLEALLRRSGLPFVGVPVAAPIRSNVTLLEVDGVVTKVNEPGPRLSAAEVAALLAAGERAAAVPATEPAAGEAVRASAWMVCCGSLPPGVPADLYARVVNRSHDRGGRVAVDSSGEPLRRAAGAGADLLKPNQEELAEVTDRSLVTLGDVVDAAAVLRRLGACAVLVSLGRDGAVLVGPETYHGEAPPTHVVSTVGAGDALLAGFLAAGGVGPAALRVGLAWAAACCRLPHSDVPAMAPDAGRQIVIHDRLDRDRPLTPSPIQAGRT